MVSVIQIRIVGTAILVLGLLMFLWGVLTWDKQVFATSFVALIISGTLLYYAWQMGERNTR